jgi:hypothetical protein
VIAYTAVTAMGSPSPRREHLRRRWHAAGARPGESATANGSSGAFLYSTTREFLDQFGLKDTADLPKVEDMADALGFRPCWRPAEQMPLAEQAETPEDQEVLEGGDGSQR